MADAASSSASTELFENFADTWMRLAHDNEYTKALLEHWFDPKLGKAA
jgi:hypothetical protein